VIDNAACEKLEVFFGYSEQNSINFLAIRQVVGFVINVFDNTVFFVYLGVEVELIPVTFTAL
jgi:hypothetical protein